MARRKQDQKTEVVDMIADDTVVQDVDVVTYETYLLAQIACPSCQKPLNRDFQYQGEQPGYRCLNSACELFKRNKVVVVDSMPTVTLREV